MSVSLNSNEFTLSIGTYKILAEAPLYPGSKEPGHRTRIYNVSDSLVELIGRNEQTKNKTMGYAVTRGIIVVSGSNKNFKIEHIHNSGSHANGFGFANNLGDEIYTTLEIIKIA